jgi:hypothetical protein
MDRPTLVWCPILALVAVIIAAVLTGPAAAAPPQRAALAQGGCTAVTFFGLRGSGEDADAEQLNMGEAVHDAYLVFESNARQAGIAVTGIGLDESEYPAVPVWDFTKDSLVLQNVLTRSQASVVTGAASLGGRLIPFLARDLSTCIVLVGYSQGAWAIGDALLTGNPMVDERVLARVSGVVLFGDPRLDPTSDVAQGDLDRPGVLRDPLVPPSVRLPTQGLYFDGADQVRSYCSSGDPVCNFKGLLDPDSLDCGPPPLGNPVICGHLDYGENGYLGAGAQFLLDRVLTGPPAASGPPRIEATETYREGELVYARVRYSGDAAGFGFRGANGSGWAEESHPFSDPSYGRVSPGQVDYPFNLACGTDGEYESDI